MPCLAGPQYWAGVTPTYCSIQPNPLPPPPAACQREGSPVLQQLGAAAWGPLILSSPTHALQEACRAKGRSQRSPSPDPWQAGVPGAVCVDTRARGSKTWASRTLPGHQSPVLVGKQGSSAGSVWPGRAAGAGVGVLGHRPAGCTRPSQTLRRGRGRWRCCGESCCVCLGSEGACCPGARDRPTDTNHAQRLPPARCDGLGSSGARVSMVRGLGSVRSGGWGQ